MTSYGSAHGPDQTSSERTRPGTEPMWVAVSDELLERIVGGVYPSGTAIPTETQLGEEFAVSRTVVREAVRVLDERGLIRIQRGRGTIVTPPSEWQAIDPAILTARLRHADRERVLRELMVVRRSLEPELAAIAAQNADDEQVARLGASVDRLLDALDDPERYRAADAEFHSMISQIADVSLAHEFFRLMAAPLLAARGLTDQIAGSRESAHAHHLEIFRCIRDRDPDGARAAMTAHILWAEQRLDQVL